MGDRGLLSRGLRVFQTQGGPATVRRATAEVRDRTSYGYERLRGRRPFLCNGEKYDCLVHMHNRTWTNERAVEIPLAKAFLAANSGPTLEVGNVISHYGESGHVVVDKYETNPNVLNVDIIEYVPTERFRSIICISTLEHVGWDEEPKEATKVDRAVRHLRDLLQPAGRMLITCPLSYNPHLDELIAEERFDSEHESFLVRRRRGWQQTTRVRALAEARMDARGTNAVWVAEFSATSADHR